MKPEVITQLNSIDGLSLSLDADLTRLTTLQLKSKGHLLVCATENALIKSLEVLRASCLDYQILGNGSNALLPEILSTPLIKIDFKLDKEIFNKEKSEYELPASTPLNVLTSKAIKYGFVGWNSFTGIPGSLGGAIYMNAGTSKGEIGSIVKSVRILRKSGEIENLKVSEKDFSYRKNHFLNHGDFILSAVLSHHGIDSNVGSEIKKYLKLRSETQPLWEKTCGCTFKNHKITKETFAAGRIIDIMGLKGVEHKGLKISTKHANFIENLGGATKDNYIELVDKINSEVEKRNGYRFETEVIIFR